MIAQNPLLRVLKNTATLSAGKVFVMLFSFVFVVYAANYLGVEGFGKYSLIRGYYELFLSLAAAALGDVIIRELAKQRAEPSQYLNTSVVLVSLLSLVAAAALLLVVHLFPYSSDTRNATYLACIALLPGAITMVYQGAFMAFEKAEYVTAGLVIEGILRTALSMLALLMGYGLLSLFVVLIVARVIVMFYYVWLLRRFDIQPGWSFDRGYLRSLVRDWRVFAVENSLSDLFWNLDIIVLSFFHGEVVVGLYSAASRIPLTASLVATSFTRASFPYISQLYEESRQTFQRVVEGSVKYLLVLVLPGALLLTLLGEQVILIFFDASYLASTPIFQVLAWTLIFRFLNPYLSYLLFARVEQEKSLQVAAVSLVFYVGAILLLVPRWAGVGAAWALLLSLLVSFALYFAFSMKREAGWRMIKVFGRMGLVVVAVAMFMWLARGIPLVLLLLTSGLLYLSLLLLLRIPTPEELNWLRRSLFSALRLADKGYNRA